MPKYNLLNTAARLPQPIKKITPFLLFSIAIGINIYVRLFPAYLPQLKQEAKLNVENKAIENITKNVESSYPEFNPLIKKKIILQAFGEDKKNKDGFKNEINDEYAKLKEPHQDEHGQTYILEVDGYQWMRYVENILKNGHPGDRLKNGQPYDDYMLAPVGSGFIPNKFFLYLSAFLYRIAAFFFNQLSLTLFLFYLPLLYATVFLALLYLSVRYFFSDIAAFFSVIFVGLNRIILPRTCCGWFDQDSLILALPLIIVLTISLSVKNSYNLKKRLYYTILAACVVGIYAGIWMGYWWIFSICAAYYFYAILNEYSLDRKAYKKILTYVFLGTVFFISSILLCNIILRANVLSSIFIILQDILHLGNSRQVLIWPYTYYTVGELMKTNPEVIMRNLGSPLIAIFAIIGTLLIYLKENRNEKKDFVILMVFWLFAMCFAAMKSFRFVAFLAIPVGIFFGAFIAVIFKYIFDNFRKHRRLCFLALVLLLIFVGWSGKTLMGQGLAAIKAVSPLMNDGWQKTLVYLKKNTPKNSIINSWWDYGNFFKTISDRKVIFDPQSQNSSLAYWLSQCLVENDENKVINILRMVNNSSYTLFDKMHEEIKDDFQCVTLLRKIINCNEIQAREVLSKQNISDKLKNEIMENIFLKEPPPAYFIVDIGMINKMDNISFLGNWNFSKLYVMRNRNMPREKIIENVMSIFSLTKEEAERIYSEVIIATIDDEQSEVVSKRYSLPFKTDKGKEEGDTVYFKEGIILNLSNFTARVLTLGKGYKKYQYVFIYDGNKLSSYENKDTDYKESIFFVKNKNDWYAIGLSKELAGSLFFKLYFLNGEGLKYFEPFYADENFGVYIYKIKWPKN